MNAPREMVLVTGSEGLLGKRIVRNLKDRYKVVGLDNDDSGTSDADVHLRCDLTDDRSVTHALDTLRAQHGGALAGVVHLAAYYDFSGEPSPMYEALTIEGTRRLVNALRSFKVGRFVFSSSLLVMAPAGEEGAPLTEQSGTCAEWPYPQSKLEAEALLNEEDEQLPVTVLRIAGVYDEQCNSIPISQHIQRIFEKKLESYVFPGDTTHGQPFVHLDDVVTCVQKAIDPPTPMSRWELFLVAEPDVLSQEALQNRLGKLIHGEAWPTIQVPKSLAKAGAKVKAHLQNEDAFIKPWMIDLADDHYPVEIQKAQQRLEWSPAFRLHNVLPEMITFLKSHPRRFYEQHNLSVPDDLDAKVSEAEGAVSA